MHSFFLHFLYFALEFVDTWRSARLGRLVSFTSMLALKLHFRISVSIGSFKLDRKRWIFHCFRPRIIRLIDIFPRKVFFSMVSHTIIQKCLFMCMLADYIASFRAWIIDKGLFSEHFVNLSLSDEVFGMITFFQLMKLRFFFIVYWWDWLQRR